MSHKLEFGRLLVTNNHCLDGTSLSIAQTNLDYYSNKMDSLLHTFSSSLSHVKKFESSPQRGPQLLSVAKSTYFPPILTQKLIFCWKTIYSDQVCKEFPYNTPHTPLKTKTTKNPTPKPLSIILLGEGRASWKITVKVQRRDCCSHLESLTPFCKNQA